MTRLITRIAFRPTHLSGRSGPILPGRDHRCTVFFRNPELDDHGYECRLLLKDAADPLRPGDTVDEVPMALLSEDEVIPRIRIGATFDLWEGKIIGEGEIIAIES